MRLSAGELTQEILETATATAATLRRRALRIGTAEELAKEVAQSAATAALAAGLRLRGARAADHHFEEALGVEHGGILPVHA